MFVHLSRRKNPRVIWCLSRPKLDGRPVPRVYDDGAVGLALLRSVRVEGKPRHKYVTGLCSFTLKPDGTGWGDYRELLAKAGWRIDAATDEAGMRARFKRRVAELMKPFFAPKARPPSPPRAPSRPT